jgi:polar amino acid transport system substrate-binding protein
VNKNRRIACLNYLKWGLAASLSPCISESTAHPTTQKPSKLILVYDESYAPYSYLENGEVKGIMPAILELLLGKTAGIQLEHKARPWRRAQAEVKSGIADAMCTFASTERQEFALSSSHPIVVLKPHLFYTADSPARKIIEKATTREELLGLEVLDQDGNQWARQNLKDFPKLHFAPTIDSVIRMLAIGRADLYISLSPIVTRWSIKKLGLTNTTILSKPASFIASDVPFSLLVRKDYPHAKELLKIFDDAFQQPGAAAAVEKIFLKYT